MDDWLSYRLSDLILFSPQTYYRMFAQYHARIFPLQVIFLASAIALPIIMRRSPERAERVVAAVLAAWWLWVAIAFHLARYSTINWAARSFALVFAAQGLLLAWFALTHRRPRSMPNQLGAFGLFGVAALAPAGSLLAGRELTQLELIGVTPDPTAIATLAFAVTATRFRLALAIIPLVWCAIGGATLWALDSVEAWIPLLGAIAGLGLLLRRRRPARLTAGR